MIKFIAEIGSNWEGDLDLGKSHIKHSKESGASFVKFQMWRAKDLYDESDEYWDDMKKSELTESVARELKNYSDEIGIEWFCSPFNPEAVDFLESINVKTYKIASITTALKHKFALETIKKIGETKKQVFISTGFDVDKNMIEQYIDKKNIHYAYCVPNYPANDEEINWNELIECDFFSDHTLGITMPLIFCSIKQQNIPNSIFVEKHVKFANSSGPDSPFSITYEELSNMMNHLKRIESLSMKNIIQNKI